MRLKGQEITSESPSRRKNKFENHVFGNSPVPRVVEKRFRCFPQVSGQDQHFCDGSNIYCVCPLQTRFGTQSVDLILG